MQQELVVDNFAGAGGASIGIERAIGRPIDYAINHSAAAVEAVLKIPQWEHLRPLLELRPLYRWLREPGQRLRKEGGEARKDGSLVENQHRMGPLTLEARAKALELILDIQTRARVDLINGDEEARIRELIEAKTWPDKWSGDEPRADEPFEEAGKPGLLDFMWEKTA